MGGLLALWVAWLAVVQARMIGINFLLSILVLVWVADVFAYFAGRAFGLKFTRNRLAPAISPGGLLAFVGSDMSQKCPWRILDKR